MKNLAIKLLIILWVVLTLQSCKPDILDNGEPCRRTTITYEKLETVYKQIMPYTGKETLKFLKNGKDTLVFEGQDIDSGSICEAIYPDMYCRTDGADQMCYQFFKYRFIEKSGKDSLVLYKYQKGSLPGKTGSFTGVFKFYIIRQLINTYMTVIGTDQIDTSFNGIQYNSITRFSTTASDTSEVYINRENGVVHFKIEKDYYTFIP